MKTRLIAICVAIMLVATLTSCTDDTVASIDITHPANASTVTCDVEQGDDQCYISVSGKAKLPKNHHICLFLRFQGEEEGWIGGGPGYEINGEWEISHVGIGPFEDGAYPPLVITGLVTKDTCTTGSAQTKVPDSIVETVIQVKR